MKKALVAYFSASGVTEQVAEKLASAAHADCFRIQPKIAYTKADLDWTNKSSRSSVEMSDPASRPEIVNEKLDILSYDAIFIGFPIWWYNKRYSRRACKLGKKPWNLMMITALQTGSTALQLKPSV